MAKNNIDGFDAGGIVNGLIALSGEDFSSFDMSTERERLEQGLPPEFNRETEPRIEVEVIQEVETVLKSVYCNYRGRLTVYDIHGQKVQDLSGMITYDKYTEIERRSNPDITEFDGIEDYRRIGAELKKTVINDQSGSMFAAPDDEADFADFSHLGELQPQDPFSQSVSPVSFGAPQQPQPNPTPSGAYASASSIALANAIRKTSGAKY